MMCFKFLQNVIACTIILFFCFSVNSSPRTKNQKNSIGFGLNLRKLVQQNKEARKDYVKQSRILENLLLESRESGPLHLRKIVLVKEPPKGIGIFNAFKTSEIDQRQFYIYIEVEGFHTRKILKSYEIDLAVQGAFRFENEEIPGVLTLGGHQVITKYNSGVTAFAVHLSLSDKSPLGTYGLMLKVKDRVSAKEAEKEISFKLQ